MQHQQGRTSAVSAADGVLWAPGDDPSALYGDHVGAVLGHLTAQVGGDLGEELTVQTLVEAWEQRDAFDPTAEALDAWLLDIASAVLARHLQGRHRGRGSGATDHRRSPTCWTPGSRSPWTATKRSP